MMTPRERWLAIFSREKPDRIPTDYWATDEVTDRLMREFKCSTLDQLYDALHIDGVTRIEPPCTKPHHPDDPEADRWGLRRKKMGYGAGSYDEFDNHPLASVTTVEEIHSYKWPNPVDHDFDAFRTMVRNVPRHRFVRSGEYEPFLLYCAMRGLEQGLMDFLEYPDVLEAALEHIFQYHYLLNQRIYEIGQGVIDITYLAEDLGGQRGLLMSHDDIRRFILPYQKKMADLARSHGLHIFYHTDGDVYPVIPDLIGITGIELLNPIQWRCPSMDREALARDFGDKIIFHGAMDNQQTLPFGTADDVRAEVLENMRIFKDARWICAPCHNLQPITPTENIVAMYNTVYELGRL
jgi:uroporphyrinogen decarboxylase